MTAPGGAFGESAHDDEANPPPASTGASEQPVWGARWNPTAAYPPPNVPPGYPPNLPADYPEPMAPPEYGQPAGYGPPWHPGDYPSTYPGGYYPPDYLGGYGPTQPGMNVLAIASLISSFTGVVCCIGSIVAIALGAIALNQIKRTRQEGYGLAVAGIVIGIATLLVSLIVAVFALHSH